jgi:hypothetical protein
MMRRRSLLRIDDSPASGIGEELADLADTVPPFAISRLKSVDRFNPMKLQINVTFRPCAYNPGPHCACRQGRNLLSEKKRRPVAAFPVGASFLAARSYSYA